MRIPREREDLSRFLVHLTRDYNDKRAYSNLISILRDKTIYARNAHCLVMHKIKKMGFTPVLQREFNTVCFTETPLTQIQQLLAIDEERKIELKPYGLIFWKDDLFERGASPAVYINAKGTSVNKFLLDEFHKIFERITTLKKFKKSKAEHYENIVHYYSLVNVVKDSHDFMWEREWRHHGNFRFKYEDIVAIIANNPDGFEKVCKRQFKPKVFEYIRKLPIINPNWSCEELIEKMTIKLWDKLSE